MTVKLKKYWFMFTELVKRDFIARYKKTFLGVLWSVLNPVCEFFVMRMIFTNFFGRDTPYYTTYLFTGVIVMSLFSGSTTSGMSSLTSNSGIITSLNTPKILFLLSSNVANLINFGMTLIIYFIFMLIDGLTFRPIMLLMLYPIIFLVIFNIGTGMILSAMYVMFKDMQYIYGIFLKLLSYVSAIFYYVDKYDETIQKIFLINPVYDYITYIRTVVVYNEVPPLYLHLICGGYALGALLIGSLIYKYNSQKFVIHMI